MTFYNQTDREILQREIITLTIFELDEVLRRLKNRDLLSRDEVVNMLLDVRQVLNS